MKKDLIIVLYGSTGDLSFRKLLPAITKLKKDNVLPEKTLVLALGRRDFNNETYLDFVKTRNNDLDIASLKDLVLYHKMQITEESDYNQLLEVINNHKIKTTRIVHYLSVAPELMLDIASHISSANVVQKNDLNASLIFEKPFGSSYLSANNINRKLWELFDENQIYRMDHYLGKQIISDILDLRFKNNSFASMLSNKNVKEIEVVVKEEVGILNRGTFYDATGASKDMFQSHILQIVSLLMMDKPKTFSSKHIIDKKVKVLKNLKYNKKNLVFGQYSGYLTEENVSDKSLTETLLSIELVSNKLFKKIPVKVLTGKKMDKKETYIKYTLKDRSEVTFNIYPEYSIELNARILNQTTDFSHKITKSLDEYAMLMNGAINYEKELFVRWDEIEESWKFVDNLVKEKKELVIYTEKLK